jgi:hypothetical protein
MASNYPEYEYDCSGFIVVGSINGSENINKSLLTVDGPKAPDKVVLFA